MARVSVLVSVLVLVLVGCGGGRSRDAAPVSAEPGREVTIYDGGAAVVVERRWVALRAGDNEVVLGELAATVQPDSIAVRALGGAAVTERWFEAGVAADAVLARAIGKEVEVVREAGAVRGRLVGAQGSVLLVDSGGGRIAVPLGEVISVGVAGAAPAARPVVHARVRADGAGRQLFELVYSAGALGFGVSYELEVVDGAARGPRVRLRARARIDNRGGLELAGARVRLVTGALDDPGHAPVAFWSGRLQLPGTTARDVDAVATAAPVAARYEAVYRGAVADTVNAGIEPHHGVASQPVVARHLLVALPRGGPLGAVLPAGPAVVTTAPAGDDIPVRVVTALAERVVAGEEARFPLGVEPALVGTRRQVRVDRAADLSRVTESYEIAVSNRGPAPARVRVVEPLSRSVRVTVDASEPHASHDAEARELAWIVDVPPGAERKVTYTATYRF